MIDTTFKNIKSWFNLSFRNCENYPIRTSLNEYYMQLV